MRGRRIKAPRVAFAVTLWWCILMGAPAFAQAPEGEMRWALYVTISPTWFDPGESGVAGLNSFCICGTGRYGNAAVRIEETVITGGTYAYGGYPDLDELFKQQDVESDVSKREALLHRIQRIMHERVVVAPLFLYVWPSGIGPRVQEPGLMLINPYPWSAPYEDVRLKKP